MTTRWYCDWAAAREPSEGDVSLDAATATITRKKRRKTSGARWPPLAPMPLETNRQPMKEKVEPFDGTEFKPGAEGKAGGWLKNKAGISLPWR